MRIKSRGELAQLIKDCAVETYPAKNKPGRKIVYTVIYIKRKDKFYRVEWGEVTDKDNVGFLWYNPKMIEVILNPKGHEGWFTKKETRKLYTKGGVDVKLKNVLSSVENNIVPIKGMDGNEINNLGVVGAFAGKGKTYYAIMRTVEALLRREKVLFFSTEESKEEVSRKIVNVIVNTRIGEEISEDFSSKSYDERVKIATAFVESLDIEIIYNPLMNTNYIVSTMNAKFNTPDRKTKGFVVIDHLRMSVNEPAKNTREVEAILSVLEYTSIQLDCKTLVTTQLASRR